eukprot:643135-Prymnesium_polylepis.1
MTTGEFELPLDFTVSNNTLYQPAKSSNNGLRSGVAQVNLRTMGEPGWYAYNYDPLLFSYIGYGNAVGLRVSIQPSCCIPGTACALFYAQLPYLPGGLSVVSYTGCYSSDAGQYSGYHGVLNLTTSTDSITDPYGVTYSSKNEYYRAVCYYCPEMTRLRSLAGFRIMMASYDFDTEIRDPASEDDP